MSEEQSNPEPGFAVVIDSIGTGSPAASQLLAEGLGIPSEIVLKAIYNAPSVMFHDIPEETATTFVVLLEKLGIEAHKVPAGTPAPPKLDPVDVGVYIEDATTLPTVCGELSEFLGCEQQEALALLATEPCVVLGGVSPTTAQALEARLSAEIIVSDPRTALYRLDVIDQGPMTMHQLRKHLAHLNLPQNEEPPFTITDLDYTTSQGIWSKFQSTGSLKLRSQAFQRYEIVLTGIDESKPDPQGALTQLTGMPEEIVGEVLENLPIQVEASLSQQDYAARLAEYNDAGLISEARLLSHPHHKLVIDKVGDLQRTKSILSHFLDDQDLPCDPNAAWESPVPMGDLLARFAVSQLEAVGCEADYEIYHI